MPNLKKKKKHERKQRGGLAVTRELGGGRIRGQPPWKRDGESRGSRGRQARAASRGGAAQDPAQPVGPARGACEPGGHTPARPGWGGRQATFLSLCKATARITPAPRARAHAGLSNIFGSVVNFSRETCALRARCQGEELRPGGGPRPSTPRCERFGNAAPPRRAGRSHQLKRRSDQGRSGSPDPGRIRRGLHARLRGGASALGC